MDALQDITFATVIDTTAVILVVLGALRGVRRGLAGELARVICLALMLGGGLLVARQAAPWMAEHSRLEMDAARALVLLLALVLLWTGLLLIRMLLGKVMQMIFEPVFNRVGGFLAGALRAAIVVVTVMLAVYAWPHAYLRQTLGEDSMIGRHVIAWIPFFEEALDSVEIESVLEQAAGLNGS